MHFSLTHSGTSTRVTAHPLRPVQMNSATRAPNVSRWRELWQRFFARAPQAKPCGGFGPAAGAAHALSKGSRRQPALRRYVHADLKLDPPKRNRASAWNGSVEIPASEVMPNSGTGHIARNNPTQSDAGWPANEAAITPQQSVPAPGIRPATSQPAAKPAAAQVQRVKHKQVDGGCHPTQEPHADADHNLLSGNSLGSRPSAYRPRPPQRPRRLEVREQRRSSGGKHVYRLADSKRLRICLLWLDSQTTTWDLPKYFHLSRFRQQRKTEMSHYIPDTGPQSDRK